MNKNIWIIIGVIACIALVGGVYASHNSKSDVMTTSENTTQAEKTMEDTEDAMDTEKTMMNAGAYEEYTVEKLARAETGDVVLFFKASWCPSCRGLDIDIEKNRDAIPEEVSILKVDYDTEIELKKKYGVTYQHTLVQVDMDGTLIKKWSGSPTLTSLVSEIE